MTKKSKKAIAKTLSENSQAVETMWLRDFVNFAKGDPLLSSWEAYFVGSMSQRVYDYVAGGERDQERILSHKQIEVIKKISIKIGFGLKDPPPVVIDDPDDHVDDLFVEIDEDGTKIEKIEE